MTRFLGRYTRALVVAAAALALTVPTAATASDQQSAERASAASGLTVRFQSWGPLELGMNHRQSLRTGMVTRKLGRCEPGYQMKKRFLERGFAVWRGKFPRMHVRMIVVTGSVDRTTSGAGEGTTLRELRACTATGCASVVAPSSRGSPARATTSGSQPSASLTAP